LRRCFEDLDVKRSVYAEIEEVYQGRPVPGDQYIGAAAGRTGGSIAFSRALSGDALFHAGGLLPDD
jgi:hypothetical protein